MLIKGGKNVPLDIGFGGCDFFHPYKKGFEIWGCILFEISVFL
jgi:hypothetical protein